MLNNFTLWPLKQWLSVTYTMSRVFTYWFLLRLHHSQFLRLEWPQTVGIQFEWYIWQCICHITWNISDWVIQHGICVELGFNPSSTALSCPVASHFYLVSLFYTMVCYILHHPFYLFHTILSSFNSALNGSSAVFFLIPFNVFEGGILCRWG